MPKGPIKPVPQPEPTERYGRPREKDEPEFYVERHRDAKEL